MSAETKHVLEMLQEGKITAEDAERLLDKLSGTSRATSGTSDPGVPKSPNAPPSGGKPKYLRIFVQRPGRENVNFRIPLALAKAGSWLALIPPRVTLRLAEQGIDLGPFRDLNPDQIGEALENTDIDINREDGRKVRIYCE